MIEACRVLVVEDEYFLAADLELALQSEGAEIVGPIYELSEALNQVAQGGFDVAVLGSCPLGWCSGSKTPARAPPNSAVAGGRLAVVIAESPVGLGCETSTQPRNRR